MRPGSGERVWADAGVKDFADLRRAPLQQCDQLADSVHNWAVGLAAAEGGITGFFGLPALVADVPLVISFALRTIHRIGLCYGFEMKTEEDRRFVLGVLAASGANSIEEKVAALAALRAIEVTLAKQTWKKMAEQAAKEALSKEAGILAVRNPCKAAGYQSDQAQGTAVNSVYRSRYRRVRERLVYPRSRLGRSEGFSRAMADR